VSNPLTIGLAQLPRRDDRTGDMFAAHVADVVTATPHLDLLIYPEFHLEPETSADLTDAEVARSLDDARQQRLAQVAREHGIWLIPGSFHERTENGTLHNTAVAYSPDGERVAVYRKVFPWLPYEPAAPGAEFCVFDLGTLGKVGMSICYDMWFPELWRHLAWMGADLIVNMVQTPTSDREQETTLVKAAAITNQVFVASVNAAAPTGIGRSLLVDPQGRVRAHAEAAEPVILTDVIDLDEAALVRERGTAGLNRIWNQFETCQPLELPAYSGRVDPHAWRHGAGAPSAGIEGSAL
jgi:predicted amidohydrolase